MTWTALTYGFGSKLTSAKMTQNQDNFTALANGDSGAPPIQQEALVVTMGLVMLNSGSISSGSNLNISLASYSAYKHFKVRISQATPNSGAPNLAMITSPDGGTTMRNSNADHDYVGDSINNTPTATPFESGTVGDSAYMRVGGPFASNGPNNFTEIELSSVSLAVYTGVIFHAYGKTTGAGPGTTYTNGMGNVRRAEAVNYLRFYWVGGATWTAGEWELYGYNTSVL